MTRQLAILVLGTLHTIGCTADVATPIPSEEAPQAVIGGTVDNGDPAVGQLYAQDGNTGWVCTASLISPTVMLTAAHCTHDAGASAKMWAHFGTSEQGAQWQKVVSWKHHPSFVSSRFYDGYDIAVVVLEKAQTTAPLPYAHSAPQQAWVGQMVRVVGYGNTNGQTASGSGTKREATTTFNSWDSFLIEVGYTGKTTCQGDSGGPTFKSVGGVETIIGVTSFGEVGCTNNGLMSRVDAYAAWVDAQVAANGGTPTPNPTPTPTPPPAPTPTPTPTPTPPTAPTPPPAPTPTPPAAPNCPWEAEGNGSSATANALCADNSIYGTIESSADQDWFTWTVGANKTYYVTLAEPGGYNFTLYKLAGGVLQEIATADQNASVHEVARSTPTGGTYFAKVWSWSGSARSDWGYSLKVRVE